MEDLDALLADLQSSVPRSARSQSPGSRANQSPAANHHHPPSTAYTHSTPVSYSHRSPGPQHHNGQFRYSSDSNQFYANGDTDVNPQKKVYYQESKEEVRTETRSSGPNPAPETKTDELESLLSELNSSRYTGIVDRSSGAMAQPSSAGRPSVDYLLNELNSVNSTTPRPTMHQQQSASSHHPPPLTASTATRDLDDLMAELSDFKVKEAPAYPVAPAPPSSSKLVYNSTYKSTTTTSSSSDDVPNNKVPTTIIDVHNASVKPTQNDKLRSPALVRKLLGRTDTYAKPQKPRSPSPPPPPPPAVKAPSPPAVNELDCMLGSLTTHMTEQGVNTSNKGSCCACDKPIVGQVITALGKTWHPEHFKCGHCKQELGAKNFFERDGQPYCESCYHELFSPRCAYCDGSILDKCVTALDKNWHPEHFFCAQCGNTFGEAGFHEKDGKAYCREDYYNMFAPKCGGCNSPIMENYISALNTQWHPECFVCRDCRQPFNGGSFFDHEGQPYCETHYHAKRGSLCYGCHKPITGRCVTAMFRKYHPEHFTCSFCLRQLNKGTFKEQNDKPYCHGCFEKLFG